MQNIDKIPEVDDTFEKDGLIARVLTVDGRRAQDIKITVKENENDVQAEE